MLPGYFRGLHHLISAPPNPAFDSFLFVGSSPICPALFFLLVGPLHPWSIWLLFLCLAFGPTDHSSIWSQVFPFARRPLFCSWGEVILTLHLMIQILLFPFGFALCLSVQFFSPVKSVHLCIFRASSSWIHWLGFGNFGIPRFPVSSLSLLVQLPRFVVWFEIWWLICCTR
jgi:hypothetical protein